jgi:hypothetical protein
MFRTHPLAAIPSWARMRIFLPLLISTLLLMLVFNVSGASLATSAAPMGIVSLEFASNRSQAASILASWDANTQLRAAFGLGLDYLYMPLYSTTIGLACVWTADVLRRRRWPLAAWGIPLAWGLWLAALCDAIENVALTIVIFGSVVDPWPALSSVCASIKFALIILGLIYALYGASAAISRRSIRGF